jgi:hypothetical protein
MRPDSFASDNAMPELDPAHSKLLASLTVTAIKHLGDSTVIVAEDNNMCPEWRMARIGDVALLEKPADGCGPKRIDCYQIVERGTAFRLDPARLIYSLQWKHNAEPPDVELVLIQTEPAGWVNIANLTLLGELRRRAPEAIDWDAMADVVPVLDAFEAAMGERFRRDAER